MTASICARNSIRIPSETVHVWHLKLSTVNQAAMQNVLSKDEWHRAAGYCAQEARTGFITRRGMLKTILAHYLGCLPSEISIALGEFGKPYLESRIGYPTVSFSMSSREDIALVALSAIGNVGIDIESIFPIEQYQELLSVFATNQEAQYCVNSPDEKKLKAFFRLWTFKEAILKAVGCGFLGSPKSVNIPEERECFDVSASHLGIVGMGKRIYCRTLDLRGEYAGALASDQSLTCIKSYGMDDFLKFLEMKNSEGIPLSRSQSISQTTLSSRQ